MTNVAFNLLKRIGISHHGAVELLPKITAHSYDADTVISDRPLKAWVYVASGLVGARSMGSAGLLPVCVYGPGAWFGEAALFDDDAVQFEYLCLTPAQTYAIPVQDVRLAFEREDNFSRYTARLFSSRAQHHAETLRLMRDGGPCLRIVMGLAAVAEAVRSPLALAQKKTHQVKSDDSLVIPVKQALLASMCGVSRGVFSVCLQNLAAANWVSMNYSSLVMLRIPVWMRFYASCRRIPLDATKLDIAAILGMLQESAEFVGGEAEKTSQDCSVADKQAG